MPDALLPDPGYLLVVGRVGRPGDIPGLLETVKYLGHRAAGQAQPGGQVTGGGWAVGQQAHALEVGQRHAELVGDGMYLGAIASASLIGLCYGRQATDAGLHRLAVILVIAAAALLAVILADRSLAQTAR